jgi:hypothetical protein
MDRTMAYFKIGSENSIDYAFVDVSECRKMASKVLTILPDSLKTFL